ncbi:MAG: hypothetical protein NTY35_05790 [Planctomycetota bacterium]|nr:hypothetical protein [Planctomycetota bacterium]
MTILLAVLSVCPSTLSPARPAPLERVDRHLVALRVVRDLDRDGVQDLCLRAQADGRAEIAALSAAQGSVLWRASGPEGVVDWGGAPMPGALAPLGDLDRDGIGDMAALWRDTDSAGEQRGVVLAFHAGSDGHVLRAIDLGRGPAREFATILAATGDLDGDLLPDLIALAPARDLFAGRIAAISSASCDELWSGSTSARGDEHGTSIAQLRDVDGDGTVDTALVVADGIDVLSGRDGRVVKHIPSEVMREVDAQGQAAQRDGERSEAQSSGAGMARAVEAGAGEAGADVAGTDIGGTELATPAAASAEVTGTGTSDARTAAQASDALDEAGSVSGGSPCCSCSRERRELRDASPAPLPARHWDANGSLAVLGDLDGDGVLDLYLPQRVSIGQIASTAIVSVGHASLLARRELPVWSLELCSAGFRAAGDMDGDKRIDILCADAGWNLPGAERSGGVDVGAVHVLSGMDGSVVRTWHGGRTLARVGAFSAMAGDVDRDGTNDVWMSAVDTAARPHEVLGLASGRTGEFLRWIDLGRMSAQGLP